MKKRISESLNNFINEAKKDKIIKDLVKDLKKIKDVSNIETKDDVVLFDYKKFKIEILHFDERGDIATIYNEEYDASEDFYIDDDIEEQLNNFVKNI